MTGSGSSRRVGLSVFSYCIIAYGWSWLCLFCSTLSYGHNNSLPIIWSAIGVFGPTVAAIGVTAWHFPNGNLRCKPQLEEVCALLAQGLRWRFSWQWYGLILGLPPLICSLALFLHTSLGATVPRFLWVDGWFLEPLSLILVLLVASLGEEFGWRGFLLPVLQSRLNALWASVCTGMIWAVWHLPLFFIPGAIQYQFPFSWFPLYVCQVVALAVIFTWVYNSTQGSVFGAILLHTSIDSWGVLTLLPENLGSLRPFAIATLSLGIVAMLVVWRFGATHLSAWHQQNLTDNTLDLRPDTNT